MQRRTPTAILVGFLVLLAGCTGAPLGGSPTAGTDTTNTADGGSLNFYISDEENAIDDFRHLNVTVTEVGFKRTGDGGGEWIVRDGNNTTVDLTELQGANSSLIDTYDLPNGTYETVFVHVGEVNGTLENGEQVNVKLPSEKLHVTQGFTMNNSSEIDFVFDISVHKAGKSGKYILKPVVSESGTDVPINDIDDHDEADEDDLNATFVGNVTQGENATIEVTRNGTPVEDATVVVNEEQVGTTDADGRLTFAVPENATELEVKVTAGEDEAELEVEFEEDESTETDESTDTESTDTEESTETATDDSTEAETDESTTDTSTATPTDA